MKRTAALAAALLLTACATIQTPGLQGTWTFKVPTAGGVTNGVIRLSGPGDRLGGSLTTDQGDEVLPIKAVDRRGRALRIVVGSPQGDVVFTGQLDVDAAGFDGVVVYHTGQSFPMCGRRQPN
jgi:hypothetical protein